MGEFWIGLRPWDDEFPAAAATPRVAKNHGGNLQFSDGKSLPVGPWAQRIGVGDTHE